MIKILFKNIIYDRSLLRAKKNICKSFKIRQALNIISPFLLWKNIFIYTGNCYKPIIITKEKIGFNFYSFLSRNFKQIKKINIEREL